MLNNSHHNPLCCRLFSGKCYLLSSTKDELWQRHTKKDEFKYAMISIHSSIEWDVSVHHCSFSVCSVWFFFALTLLTAFYIKLRRNKSIPFTFVKDEILFFSFHFRAKTNQSYYSCKKDDFFCNFGLFLILVGFWSRIALHFAREGLFVVGAGGGLVVVVLARGAVYIYVYLNCSSTKLYSKREKNTVSKYGNRVSS